MADRTSLRDYQRDLAARLQNAGSARVASKLGLQVCGQRWLVDLRDAGEVIPVPPVTPVPLTKPWFKGVANVRGNLYSVIDFARFIGRESQGASGQARLVLFGPRAGDLNAGIVVQRVLGLRNLAELAPSGTVADAPAWYAQRWMDADGRAWQEIDLSRLARDDGFLQIGT
jgi:twitching motility protein PilI